MITNEKNIMRVSEVQRERYTLIGEMGEIGAKLKGNLHNSGEFPLLEIMLRLFSTLTAIHS